MGYVWVDGHMVCQARSLQAPTFRGIFDTLIGLNIIFLHLYDQSSARRGQRSFSKRYSHGRMIDSSKLAAVQLKLFPRIIIILASP